MPIFFDSKIVATDSNPTPDDIGELIGESLADHMDGDQYELSVLKVDGSIVLYNFVGTEDGRITLRSVSVEVPQLVRTIDELLSKEHA